jgi:hypothetical protein
MTSSQQIAFAASIKHQKVNEISCDANPDIVPHEGNKGRRHGMMHTHLHCKQQEMKVVDDEFSLREIQEKNRCIRSGIGHREMEKQNSCRVSGWYL